MVVGWYLVERTVCKGAKNGTTGHSNSSLDSRNNCFAFPQLDQAKVAQNLIAYLQSLFQLYPWMEQPYILQLQFHRTLSGTSPSKNWRVSVLPTDQWRPSRT